MPIHIIIDGYNLIRQSSRLSILDHRDIQMGRQALVDLLAAYKKLKPHRVSVVFDGTHAPLFLPQRNRQKGISILFSHHPESADAVIKRMARQEREKALVVSSDLEILRSAAAWGAATISAENFEKKLRLALDMDGMPIEAEVDGGWKPTTKKKGPRRRLPKRQRKNKAKIREL